MMVGASRAHGLIVSNMVVALHSRLDPARWQVISEFGLDAGPDTLRYPDIVVDHTGGGAKDRTAAPVLLAEVLSPSTAETDFGDKTAEYLRIPSLLAYIILSQDEPKAWVWIRAGTEFTPGPAVLGDPAAIMQIPALRLELPLAELYAGIHP